MESQRLRVLTFTSLAHFVNDGTFLLFPLLMVYYNTVLKVSLVFLGAMAVIYTLLSGLLSPPIGEFADRHDLDAVLVFLGIALEAASVGVFATAFVFRSAPYILITLGAVVLGVGQAFYHPIGGAVLSRTFGKSSGRALGLNGALGSVGRSLSPSIVTLLIVAAGLVLGLSIFTIYMFVVAALILVGLRVYNKGSRSAVRGRGEKLDRGYYKFLLILGVIVFIRSMFITGTTNFLGEYIYHIYLSKTLAGIFLTVGFLGSIVGQPFFGWLTERKGGLFTFTVTSGLALVTFFLFMLASKQLVLSSLIYSIFTFAAFSAFPVLLGYVSQVFPKNFYTVANSYVWGVGNVVGGSAGTALVTALIGVGMSLYTSFYIMLGLAVVSMALIPLIPRRKGSF
ncbi:MFS transporter [Sulfodiicoccus acidiphilus]|uniref:MFS transporter n=1 Tax=Sulfodiicoccus acidiphilus TaxID=1670455 RepID=A0A348B223_9CREN|nr:MFS transporter [Sulfodiicoccus acidiphilus]BBD72225.1 MFS transporter [Sulfodiicoccus acidiphilus]GGU02891.1 MFS transporter [Sulfodiicoccus acidiphilus]